MFGAPGAEERWPEEWFAALRAQYEKENLRTVPVRFTARVAAGTPPSLTAADADGRVVKVTGPAVEAARNRAVTAEEVETRLPKTGGTAFAVESCEVAVAARAEIQNAKTLYLADRSDFKTGGLSFAWLRFTTETADECAAVLRAHVEGRDRVPEDLTRGLFYRGVE